MKKLKIAYSENALQAFGAVGGREIIDVNNTDYTDVAAVVITEQDSDVLKNEMIGAFKIPVMLIKDADSHVSDEIIKQVYRVIDLNETDHDFYSRQIESAAAHYEENVLPPFFKDLEKYVENGYSQFDCPGHQGGAFFRKHPAGRAFYDFFGENTFRAVKIIEYSSRRMFSEISSPLMPGTVKLRISPLHIFHQLFEKRRQQPALVSICGAFNLPRI